MMKQYCRNIALVLPAVVAILLGMSCESNIDKSLSDNEETLQASDIRDSGCKNESRVANLSEQILILKKEGDIVSCEFQGYYGNCGIEYFDIDLDYRKGTGAPDSLSIDVRPVIPAEKDCWCPYTVYFTVRDLKADRLYLNCWLYSGMVSFKESDIITLKFSHEEMNIDGSLYWLYNPGQQAMFCENAEGIDELHIPFTVNYNNQDYSVLSFHRDAIHGKDLKKLILPKSIRRVGEDASDYKCLINGRCPNLESIEVESGCPLLSSVDGVLYSSDCKTLYCHPAASKRTSYTVPEGVNKISSYAFAGCQRLTSILFPESVTTILPYAFDGCKNIEALYIQGKLERNWENFYIFSEIQSTPTVYVPESEVEYVKTLYPGKVLPLP